MNKLFERAAIIGLTMAILMTGWISKLRANRVKEPILSSPSLDPLYSREHDVGQSFE